MLIIGEAFIGGCPVTSIIAPASLSLGVTGCQILTEGTVGDNTSFTNDNNTNYIRYCLCFF